MVDSSVAAKLLVTELFSKQAAALFTLLQADPPARFYVPDLLYIECANILWKHVRRFGLPQADARQSLLDLSTLPLITVSTKALMTAALDVGLAYQLAAYDACYVVLADSLNIPLVTADEIMVRKLAQTAFDVRWIGSWPPVVLK
ncbi:MAG: type II toxin-antitoxin system VapC family toxin [Anaerolineae bacterium]|nr:type II toxin-antitoxin system VapC family toxin [Anaerolineae bacterium]